MFRNVALIFVTTLVLPIVIAYEATVIPAGPLTILPRDCRMEVNEEMHLELVGFIPRSIAVSWDVDRGGISSVLPSRDAVLVAPSEPTVVTVTVSFSPAIPGIGAPISKQCIVTAADNTLGSED